MTRCLSFAAAFVALMAVAAAQAPPAVIQPPADIQPPDISNGFFPPDTFMPDNTILPPIRPPILPPILPPIRPPAPICTPGALCRRSTRPCEDDGYYTRDCRCPEAAPAGNERVCRPASGPCDAEEYCDGFSFECGADFRQENGDICRPATGDCDVPEACDGRTLTCPALNKYKPAGAACNTIVRNGTNECPLLSTCDGFNPVCKGTQYCGCQPGWIATTNRQESACFNQFKFKPGGKERCTLASGWVIPPRSTYSEYRVDAFVGGRCEAGLKVGSGTVSCRTDGALVISLRRLSSGRTIFSRMRAFASCEPPQGCSFNELAYTSLNQRDVTIGAGVIKNMNNKCICPNGRTPYIMLYSDVATVCNSVPLSVIPLRK